MRRKDKRRCVHSFFMLGAGYLVSIVKYAGEVVTTEVA